MIAVDLPVPLLWALRWALFLGPLAAALFLSYRCRFESRRLVGALFAFLYGLGLVFVTHQIAIALGWWHYGGDALMLMGLPADIWVGGALLFGPVLFLAFPNIAPLWLVLPVIIGLHGTVFSSLKPLVWAGPGWFAGVLSVFLIAHMPAIYLARWTARGEMLAWRATLLAIGYGFLAFAVLPSLIMLAMGGTWDLVSRPPWLLAICAACLGLCMLTGLAAVQAFVIHGQGTPIPLDPTRRLVRTGLFAYLSNPMQLCTALAWIFLGVALDNIWVAAASIMAWVFVQGMVRWHHRNDLLARFPEGWPEYRAHVSEWLPRWRPWVPELSRLFYDPADPAQMSVVAWLRRRKTVGVDFIAAAGTRTLAYFEPQESRAFTGFSAIAKALNHINLIFAYVGAAILLVVLPLGAIGPITLGLGLGHLRRIRRDQLAFYDEMKTSRGDVVLLRLGPYRSWLLFDPALVELVLVRHFRSFVRFEKLMRIIAQWTGDNMLVSEGEAWRARRRKLLPAFKTARLPGYGEKAVENARRLCDALDAMADPDGMVRIDTDATMARLSLDIAMATLFDSEPPANGDEIERAIQTLSETAFRESTSPFTLPDWLPLAAKRRKHQAMAIMDRLVTEIITARLTGAASDRGDLLSILIEGHDAVQRAIRDDVMSLLIAGHETSGALLSWTFFCLAQNNSWQERLIEENQKVLSGRPPVATDLTAMPLLRAVISEVLRLYPPAYALFLRRATEDLLLGPFMIRKGDLVQITPFTLHRDARWFAEPERFKPERFLDEPTWPQYAYLPFGAGPRVCIGQNFGLMESCLVVATVLQRWRPIEAVGSVVPEPKFSLRPRGGLPMTWRTSQRQ